MLGALDRVVGPSSQQVTRIDNDSVFDGRSVDEIAIRRHDLKAASRVLEELSNIRDTTM